MSFSMAQNFTVLTDDTTFYGTATESDFYGQINLMNNAGNPLSMRWVRIEENLPLNWESSVCTPITCYPSNIDSSDYTMPINNSNNYINVHFYPNNQEGSGYIKIKVFETANPSQSYTMKFIGSTYPVGYEEQNNVKLLSFHPNPVVNEIIIKGISKDVIGPDVFIYDLSGKEMFRNKLSFAKSSIDISSIPTGIYLLKLKTDQYELVKKIVKK